MRAVLVWRDGDRAAVMLTPGWIGRLLGVRVAVVECLRREARHRAAGCEWVTEATRRPAGRLILRALDRVEVDLLPVARVVGGAATRSS